MLSTTAHLSRLRSPRRVGREAMGRAAVIPAGSHQEVTGNMSILGYDPHQFHTGRAPIEAAAPGLQPPRPGRSPLQPRHHRP
jgi:2,3-bisphosphoglycerate-independent phosphoglycerate mutase